jgi:hypothetical protein
MFGYVEQIDTSNKYVDILAFFRHVLKLLIYNVIDENMMADLWWKNLIGCGFFDRS